MVRGRGQGCPRERARSSSVLGKSRRGWNSHGRIGRLDCPKEEHAGDVRVFQGGEQ